MDMISAVITLLLGIPCLAEVVKTPLGKLEGTTMISRSGKKFHAFLGVPYARPPINNLRLQPPRPLEPWLGVKIAKDFGPECTQYRIFNPELGVIGQEDCLNLNVYTTNFTASAPVLVHFHGGAYTYGSNRYLGPHYLMDEGIVVVSANYRVGILGFLSFENADLPGNFGMKDQVMSLQWVKMNIASFGGDPNLVTIIGESAGAGSVYNHIVSPLSKGLFHRAVTQSGSSYTPWSLAPPGYAKSFAVRLMKKLGCPEESKKALPCLMKKDSKEIVSQFPTFLEWQIDPTLNFGPVLEPPGAGAFMVGPVKKWDHTPVPLMTGLSSAEGLLRTLVMLMYKTDIKWFSDNFDKLAPISVGYAASASKPDDITKALKEYYFTNQEITMNDWVNLTTMYSDAWFNIGSIDGANSHKGNVYFYYFDYPMQGKYIFASPPGLYVGSFHCGDNGLWWNISVPVVPNVSNDEELKLSHTHIKFLTNFMRHGNPTPEGEDLEWQKWIPEQMNYLNIDKKGLQMQSGLRRDHYKFWKSLKYRDNFD